MRKGLFDDKPAITTNNTVPVQPHRPAVLKPAMGPVISTNDAPAIADSMMNAMGFKRADEPAVVQVLDDPGLAQELPKAETELRETHDEAAQAGLSIAPKKAWGRKSKR